MKIKHVLSTCLCKKTHTALWKGNNPVIPLQVVEIFGITHGVITCPCIMNVQVTEQSLKNKRL